MSAVTKQLMALPDIDTSSADTIICALTTTYYQSIFVLIIATYCFISKGNMDLVII